MHIVVTDPGIIEWPALEGGETRKIIIVNTSENEVANTQKTDIGKTAGLLFQGWIIPSNSPWSTTVAFVRKRGEDYPKCIGYQRLNAVTAKDAQLVPRVDDILESLVAACYFTSLDLASGYWQIKVAFEGRTKTTFVKSRGQFKWLVMPLVLKNAPGFFQCLGTELRASSRITGPLYSFWRGAIYSSGTNSKRRNSFLTLIPAPNLELVQFCLKNIRTDGTESVIAYGSRSLHVSERNHCPTKLEVLAMHGGIHRAFQLLSVRPYVPGEDESTKHWSGY